MNFMDISNSLPKEYPVASSAWTAESLPNSTSPQQASHLINQICTPLTVEGGATPTSAQKQSLFSRNQSVANVSDGSLTEAYPSINTISTYNKSVPNFCTETSQSQQPIKFDDILPTNSFQHYAFPQFAPNNCSATFSELSIIRPQSSTQDLGDVLFSLKQTTLHPNPTGVQHPPQIFGNGIGVSPSTSNPFPSSPSLKPAEFSSSSLYKNNAENADLRPTSGPHLINQYPNPVHTQQTSIQPYAPPIYRSPYDLFFRGSTLHDDANSSFNYPGIHGYNFCRFPGSTSAFSATNLCSNDPTSFSSGSIVEKLAKTNVCNVCGKAYARPSTLKTHLRTHNGERPFKCTECSKTFSQAANLTAHLRTHNGEKPFKCEVCDRRFSQSSSVTTHMRTHTGARPYRCRMCSKSFSDSSTLTKHLRIHSGEKPYSCHICFIRFSQSGNLNRHMRVHQQSSSSQ